MVCKCSLFSLLVLLCLQYVFIFIHVILDIHNVRIHVVDIGAREDLGTLVNLMSTNFCENECMIRNTQLFVNRLLPLSPDIKEANSDDKIIYPTISSRSLSLLLSLLQIKQSLRI
jgi:hypothetical protein